MNSIHIPFRNSIVSSNNPKKVLEFFKKNISIHNLRIFGEIDKLFTIDLSRAILKEVSMASYDTKYILLLGNSFKEEAQNALLKILEDTPPKIVFVIIIENRNGIMPTVRSRLHKLYWKIEENKKALKDELDYKNLDDKKIIQYLLANKRISRDKVLELIKNTIVINGIDNNRTFNLEELDRITDLIRLLKLNSPALSILTSFLLLTQRALKRNTHM